jgi:hypothetical protein
MFSGIDLARYLRRFLAIAFGSLLLVALFNLVVDPFDRFGLNRLGVYISASREFKLRQAGRLPHDGLLVGNSRIAQIPASELRGRRFFNGGVEGASLSEVQIFLERHLQTNELVVLNLDHHILGFESDVEPSPAYAPLDLNTIGRYLLNLKTIEYSVRTIARHLAGAQPVIGSDGTIEPTHWRMARDVDDPGWLRRQIAAESNRIQEFDFRPQRLEELRRIQRLVQDRKGRLVVFFSPVHEDLLPALETGPAGKKWQGAVDEIGAMFPGVVNLTRSDFSSRTNFFRTDPVHFLPEVGKRILNEYVLPRD